METKCICGVSAEEKSKKIMKISSNVIMYLKRTNTSHHWSHDLFHFDSSVNDVFCCCILRVCACVHICSFCLLLLLTDAAAAAPFSTSVLLFIYFYSKILIFISITSHTRYIV